MREDRDAIYAWKQSGLHSPVNGRQRGTRDGGGVRCGG